MSTTGVLQLDATGAVASAGESPGDVQTRQSFATPPPRRMRGPPAPWAVSYMWSIPRHFA